MLDANNHVNQPTDPGQSPKSKSPKPKFYKIKNELENYDLLYLIHNEIPTGIFDIYMDFLPSTIKKIYLFVFNSSKVIRQILVYFLFYHSIWWTNNSISNNLAINYSVINPYLFLLILYFNYYEFLINQLILRYLIFNTFKFLHLFNLNRLRIILNQIETFLYVSILMLIFLFLQFYLNFSFKFSCFFVGPHLFFMLYNHFDINVTLMNYSLFTNELSKPMVQTYVKEIDSKIKNSKLTYTDCSNISADLYLKNNLNLTSILNTNKSMLGVNNQDCKILKSNKNKAKSKYLNILFKFGNIFQKILKFPLKLFNLNLSKIAEFILSIPKTSRIKIVKRNSFNLNHNNLNSTSASIISLNNFVLNTNLINLTNLNYIQHKCQKDAVNLREETELFRFEFNLRFKECFLRSFESIFFTFILSRICVPEFINVRNQEFLVYLTSTIFCTFISYFTYYIPMSFLISLSRNAEHLGRWICEDNNETDTSKASNFSFSRSNISNMPFTPGKWSNSKLYFENDRVSHLGKVYRVVTKFCSAIPGNKKQKFFYKLFHNTCRIVFVLFLFKLLNIGLLCYLVVLNRRWYAILINIFEILINSHTIFIVFRDFFLLYFKQKYFAQSVDLYFKDTSYLNKKIN